VTDRRPPAAWRFHERTRDELLALAGDVTVVVPLGSTEQHGHHLPVCTDTEIVTALAERAVERAVRQVPLLVTPTVPVGFAAHHIGFGGTISVGARTYADLLIEIGSSLMRQGFGRIVFLNGHGGNDAPLNFALDRLAYECATPVNLAGASYWDLAADVLRESGLDLALSPGHAGHFETSLMLALAPDLVRMDLRPADASPSMPLADVVHEGAKVRRPGDWELSDGRTDDASLASLDIGTGLIEDLVERIAAFLVKFHQSCR
jgi:creatinine amidohydrolase